MKISKILAWTATFTLALAVTAGVSLNENVSFDGPAVITAEAADVTASGQCGENVFYELDSEGTLTISGTGEMYDYIGSTTPFTALTTAKKLVIENGITSIGERAFENCTALTGALVIPDSVTTIGEYAFYNCNGFTGDLTIPGSVTSIGTQSFMYCNGMDGKLVISDGVESVGYGAFAGCSKLTGDLILPDSVTSIGGYAFECCEAMDGKLVIPDGVESIGTGAFYSCSKLTGDLILPDSVKSINNRAFYNCAGLDGKIRLPSNITAIGAATFKYCTDLSGDLVIPESVKFIGENAFYECVNLTGNLIISDGVEEIYDRAFYECGFTGDLVIPESVTEIYTAAFFGCEGFDGKLVIPEGIKAINNSVFQKCGFTGNLVIPEGVTTIGTAAFSECKNFTGDLVIPEGVTTIGDNAFSGWYGFSGKVVIPESVTSIGRCAFYDSLCDSKELFDSIVIYGSKGSYAQTYAEDCGFKFVDINKLAINSQPENFTGKIGDTAKFTIEANGKDVTYQWQQDTGKGWADINTNAARKNSISIVISQPRLAYKYRCVISDGTDTITSDAVCMKLDEKLAITTQPVDYLGKAGDTVRFAVEATGAISYQWQQNTGKGWTDITTSAGRSKAITTTVTTARLAYKYRCVISDGTNTVTSDEVCMKLDEKLAITTQPVDYLGKTGDTVRFAVEATGAISYQWQQNTGKGWTDITTSAGRSKAITTTVTTARLAYKYRCVISDGTTTITSNEVCMKLDEKLAITTQPVNFTGAIGDTAKFTIEATGVTSYQWQQNTGAGWTNINTATGRSKSISNIVSTARLSYKYRCIISDGTNTITSDEVCMKLNEKLAITSQPADYMANEGETVRFTVKASGATSYQWQVYNGKGWSNVNTSAGRTNTITVEATAARDGFMYRCIVSDGTNEIVSSEAVLNV